MRGVDVLILASARSLASVALLSLASAIRCAGVGVPILVILSRICKVDGSVFISYHRQRVVAAHVASSAQSCTVVSYFPGKGGDPYFAFKG